MVAVNAARRAAVSALLDGMERQRTAAVTAFLRAETTTSKYLRYPRLTVHVIANTDTSPGYATPVASDVAAARSATMILLVRSRAERLSSYEQAALSAIATGARVAPPLLLQAFTEAAAVAASANGKQPKPAGRLTKNLLTRRN